MSKNLYQDFADTFSGMSVTIFSHGGEVVAYVVKKGKTVFAHWYGTSMIKASVKGSGFNIANAAMALAAQKSFDKAIRDEREMGMLERAFWSALYNAENENWETVLRTYGFYINGII